MGTDKLIILHVGAEGFPVFGRKIVGEAVGTVEICIQVFLGYVLGEDDGLENGVGLEHFFGPYERSHKGGFATEDTAWVVSGVAEHFISVKRAGI